MKPITFLGLLGYLFFLAFLVSCQVSPELLNQLEGDTPDGGGLVSSTPSDEDSEGGDDAESEDVDDDDADDVNSDLPFVIYNLGLNFDTYDADLNRAGDFQFVNTTGIGEPYYSNIFIPFTSSRLPAFEYRLPTATQVISICSGTVTNVLYRSGTVDYSITVRPDGSDDAADYAVEYDHILSPEVAIGDVVAVDDVLGVVGTWEGALGRTEIMIYRSGPEAYCPFLFFDRNTSQAYEDKVTQLMLDYEENTNYSNAFNQESMIYPGCYEESVPQ